MQTFHNYLELHLAWVERIFGLQMVKGFARFKDAILISAFILELFLFTFQEFCNLAGVHFR